MSLDTVGRRHLPLGRCAFYGALSLWFCAPLFEHPHAPGITDWDQHLFYYASVMKSVVEYGQPPFWNPWYCGGNVLWANPQVPLLSPVFPLAAAVSLPLAMKINIALHYWIGFLGMDLLLRSAIGLRSSALTIYLTVVAVCSGAMALHLNVGHSVFLPCLYIPLQLYFTLQATRGGRWRDVIWAAALLALMIYNGALHVVPMSIGALGIFSSSLAVMERRWRPLLVGVAAVCLGLAVAGPKLLPVVQWVTSDRFVDARTVLERPDRMTIEMLRHAYLDPFQHRSLRFELQRSGWFEYGNYIGGLAALCFVASMGWTVMSRGAKERSLGLALTMTALILFALSAGEFSALAPASLATHVPLFSSFRIPSRYTIVFVIFAVSAAGWTMRNLEEQITLSKQARLWVGLVCLLGALDVVQQNRAQFRGVFPYAPLGAGFTWQGGVRTYDIDTTSDPYAPDAPMLRVLMANRAFFNCYESLQTARSARPDWPIVAAEGPGRLSDADFSPNRVGFSVAGGREPTHVVLNQNFAIGWRSSAGPVVPSPDGGRPSVALSPGQTGHFDFSYVPPGLAAGSALLLAALGVMAFAWRRRLPGDAADPSAKLTR